MRGIGAFVSEHAIQLENLLQSAHQASLEEEFRCDTKVEVGVESIGVGDKRTSGGTACERLQYGSFHLEETAPLERRPHRTHHCHALPGDGSGFGADDQIDVALTNPRFLAHLLVCDGQGSESL